MPAEDELDKILALGSRDFFAERVKAALFRQATVIAKQTDPDPTRDTLRRGLAQRVLLNPDQHVRNFAMAIAVNLANNPDVDHVSPSAEHIEFAVTDVWDAFAGARPAAP